MEKQFYLKEQIESIEKMIQNTQQQITDLSNIKRNLEDIILGAFIKDIAKEYSFTYSRKNDDYVRVFTELKEKDLKSIVDVLNFSKEQVYFCRYITGLDIGVEVENKIMVIYIYNSSKITFKIK